ncbi:MAG: hypothetical protein ABI783_03770 [Actinomycetota bacterium]
MSDLRDRIVREVEAQPGLASNGVVREIGGGRTATLDELRALELQGVLWAKRGRRRALHWFATPSARVLVLSDKTETAA